MKHPQLHIHLLILLIKPLSLPLALPHLPQPIHNPINPHTISLPTKLKAHPHTTVQLHPIQLLRVQLADIGYMVCV